MEIAIRYSVHLTTFSFDFIARGVVTTAVWQDLKMLSTWVLLAGAFCITISIHFLRFKDIFDLLMAAGSICIADVTNNKGYVTFISIGCFLMELEGWLY